MDTSDRLYGLRNIRAFLMIDATRGIYPTPAAVRMWMPALESAITEFAGDEMVEVVLTRGAWDGICTLLGDQIEGHIYRGRFQDAEVLRNYRDKIRAQLEAKAP